MRCCPLTESDEFLPISCITNEIRKARKAHWCEECHDEIAPGTRYQYHRSLCDGSWQVARTCLSCVEIRDHFRCGRGYVFGLLWEDLEERFFPTMAAGGPCMDGLSPAAKARLFERRMAWLTR